MLVGLLMYAALYLAPAISGKPNQRPLGAVLVPTLLPLGTLMLLSLIERLLPPAGPRKSLWSYFSLTGSVSSSRLIDLRFAEGFSQRNRVCRVARTSACRRRRYPNYAFRAIDEFAFDNSLAASSAALQTVFVDHLQARVNLGECASPEGGGFIESFFKKLTENGYQRLPSTTGNSAQSPKRRDPEKKAHRNHLTLEAAKPNSR